MDYQIEQILTVKQVCKALNCHISTIYRWEKEGTLPFQKIRISRGKVGFRKSDVMNFINSQVEEPEIEVV